MVGSSSLDNSHRCNILIAQSARGNKDSREFSPFIPRKRMGERKNPEAQAKLSQ